MVVTCFVSWVLEAKVFHSGTYGEWMVHSFNDHTFTRHTGLHNLVVNGYISIGNIFFVKQI